MTADGPFAMKARSERAAYSTPSGRPRTAPETSLGDSGGGELVTHGTDGKIRDSDTVPPGHDPFPPRDQR